MPLSSEAAAAVLLCRSFIFAVWSLVSQIIPGGLVKGFHTQHPAAGQIMQRPLRNDVRDAHHLHIFFDGNEWILLQVV